MHNDRLPRTLILASSAFNSVTGGGVTLSNLFRGWPRDRLATVTDDRVPVSRDVCDRYYFLTAQEVRYIRPLNWFAPCHGGHDGGRASRPSGTHAGSGPPGLVQRAAIHVVGSAGIPEWATLTPQLKQWIQRFEPQVLYTTLGRVAYVELARQIHEAFDLPIVVHLMDDGVTHPKNRGLFAPYLNRVYRRRFTALLGQATGRMAICQAMARAYQRRYGYAFTSFHNALDLAPWLAAGRRDWGLSKPSRVVYSGSIERHQIQALRTVCQAIHALRAAGVAVEMQIHTSDRDAQAYGAALHNPPGVTVLEALTNETVARRLAQADLLVLAVNFTPNASYYFRYSMPTKVPAYMLSGTPILVYAPGTIAVTQYAQRSGWAQVVDQPGVGLLRQTIQRLLQDEPLRSSLGQRARRVAVERHDAAKVRQAFGQQLRLAADRGAASGIGSRVGPVPVQV